MGAFKPTAASRQTPDLRSPADARRCRTIDAPKTIVEGGGLLRLADGEYHAAALARYDGQWVTTRPSARDAGLDVLLGGRLLCRASALPPEDDDTGWAPIIVSPSPSQGGGSARLKLPADASTSRPVSATSTPRAASSGSACRRHETPGRRKMFRGQLVGPLAYTVGPVATTAAIGVGSGCRRHPLIVTAPPRGPPGLQPPTARSQPHRPTQPATRAGGLAPAALAPSDRDRPDRVIRLTPGLGHGRRPDNHQIQTKDPHV